jgi:aspartyl protease family protein
MSQTRTNWLKQLFFEAPSNRIRLQTANGSVEGRLGVAEEIRIGRLLAKDVAIVVSLDSSSSFGSNIDGLLGMSFLARYEVTFSGREMRLRERGLF